MTNISVRGETTPMVEQAARILRERQTASGPQVLLEVCAESPAGGEGFEIADAGGGVRITARDGRGLLYGVGKHLRDPAWRGVTAPQKPIRAMYFATHFHNFYHDAPLEEVTQYIEDLALWGCNTLTVWFDMHHYQGIADPPAQAMVARLRALLGKAQELGMSPGLMMLANEAYASSPGPLRADWTAGHDGYFAGPVGHFHVEICPNKPGGLDLILRWRAEVLDALSGVNFDFLVIWPYDQGGCTCAACAPWGSNGYLKVAEPLARLLRERYPKAKLVLSTWYFDQFTRSEWEGLARAFQTKPGWVDYLLADDAGSFPAYPLQHGMPGGLPGLNFPEISMVGMVPWGAFGANPRLEHWQAYWDKAGACLHGGYPYSEGIHEDINKVLHLQLNWDGQRSTREIAREYAAWEFSPHVADDVVEVMLEMERTLDHALDIEALRRVVDAGGWDACRGTLPSVYWTPKVTQMPTYAWKLRKIEGQLEATARQSWRFRILYLRALLDEALYESRGRPTDASDACFQELVRIYHAEQAEFLVSPVSRRQLERLAAQMPKPPPAPPPPGEWQSAFVSQWQVSSLQQKTVERAAGVSLSDDLDWRWIRTDQHPPGFLHVHRLVGNEDGLIYVGNTFRAEKSGRWILHVGHDGGVRVFVDGRRVLTALGLINPSPVFRSKTLLNLDAGEHEIVIAMDTAAGRGWGVFVCFEIPMELQKPDFKPVFPRPATAPMLAPA